MDEGKLAIIWLILSSLGFFLLIFSIRYLISRERMAMIANGMDPVKSRRRPTPFYSLKFGLLLIGASAGLLLAFLLSELVFTSDKYYDDGGIVALYFSLILMGGGIGLLRSYKIERELFDKDEIERKEELELKRAEKYAKRQAEALQDPRA